MSDDRSLRRKNRSALRAKLFDSDQQVSELSEQPSTSAGVENFEVDLGIHFVEESRSCDVTYVDEGGVVKIVQNEVGLDGTIVIESEEEILDGTVYWSDSDSSESDESSSEMAFKFGGFGYFDVSKEDIESYLSRLRSAMIVGKVAEDHKIHALISSLGPEAFCTLRNLCAPTDPATKSYEDCEKLLVEHYIDVSLKSVQHFKLDNRVQQKGESVAKYAEALRYLAHKCKFASAEAINSYLTNVFPRNLRDDRIKMIVIPENLSFSDCVTRAKALESRYAQLSIVQAKPVESTTIATVSNDNRDGNEAAAVHALRFRPSFGDTRRHDNTRRRADSHQYRHHPNRRQQL
jgi:hypothetical protein